MEIFFAFFCQLQNLTSDETSLQITELFKAEKANEATGGPSATVTARSAAELAYQKKSENLLTDENCFKFLFVSILCLNIGFGHRQIMFGYKCSHNLQV